jgi:hypothetical protein
MNKARLNIATSKLVGNSGQLDWLPRNPRTWTAGDLERTKRSIERDPDFLEDRPLLVVPAESGKGERYIVFGGNLRLKACRENGVKTAPAVIYFPETDEDRETVKRRAMLDNGSFGSWDYDELANKWDDLPLVDLGIPAWEPEQDWTGDAEMDEDEIERKKREFEERMAAGEISEEDEEYQEFLDKFKLKKTTDDCYTPDGIYEALADWVAKKYALNRKDFVRPFYPGGDYQKEQYKPTDVVVDNPPFSILAEILNFYKTNGIRFFLFAPTLTLFSSSSSSCALPVGVAITYENGASVNTSFLTNLEPSGIRLRSEPSLYAAIKEANDKNLAEMKKQLPKYSYDHHVITAPFVGALSRLGIEFSVPTAESVSVSNLDAQKASGRAIYGKGYLVSDQVWAEREKAEREKAEREKAEREKAEREKAERWELSDRERAVVAQLTENGKKAGRVL